MNNRIIRKSFQVIIAVILLTLFSDIKAAESDAVWNVMEVSPDTAILTDHFVPILTPWRFHADDDLQYSEIEFDDSKWKLISTDLKEDFDAYSGWSGYGWFRIKLFYDSTWLDEQILIRIFHMGAHEVYINDKLFHSEGKFSTDADHEQREINFKAIGKTISIDSNLQMIIAIRFSNHEYKFLRRTGSLPGFGLEVTRASISQKNIYKHHIWLRSNQMFYGAAALAIAILFLFVYLAYRRSIDGLYFSIFTFGCFMIIYFPFESSFISSTSYWYFSNVLFYVGLGIISVFGLLFLYKTFQINIPRYFWIFPIGVFVSILFSNFLSSNMFLILPGLSLIETIRIVIIAIKKDCKGAIIVGFGFTCFSIGCALQILISWNFIPPFWLPYFIPYMAGILILLDSMSIYLALKISRTSIELSHQLSQVEKLSNQTLEQERSAKQQEIKQKLLKQEITHKALELKEAKKLEKALRDLEKAHEELKSTQTQLVQSEKMATMGMLVAGVAHEINTPVGAITSMHDTQVRAYEKLKTIFQSIDTNSISNDQISKFIRIIDDSNKVIKSGSNRVAAIVKRLRSFARLDEADLQTVNILDGLEDTLLLLHHELKQDIEVIKEFEPLPDISCYPGQLNQVFLNIIMNAKQAIVGKGTIILKSEEHKNSIIIKISDSGSGIEESCINHIFDPGFTTKGVGVGTGLGLAISYRIIEDHHGSLMVESKLGEGTTFMISLPKNLETILSSD